MGLSQLQKNLKEFKWFICILAKEQTFFQQGKCFNMLEIDRGT